MGKFGPEPWLEPCFTKLIIGAQCEPMSLPGHGSKHESRHGCLIIALTRQRSLVIYKVDNDANRPPEGSCICICLGLPLDWTWHKVNDPKVDYSGGWGRWVGLEPRLEPKAGGLSASSLLLPCSMYVYSYHMTRRGAIFHLNNIT